MKKRFLMLAILIGVLGMCVPANATVLLFTGWDAITGNQNLTVRDFAQGYSDPNCSSILMAALYGYKATAAQVYAYQWDIACDLGLQQDKRDLYYAYTEGHGWTPNTAVKYGPIDGSGISMLKPQTYGSGGLQTGLALTSATAVPLEVDFLPNGLYIAKVYGFTVARIGSATFTNVPWKIVNASNVQLAGGTFTLNSTTPLLNIAVDANVVKANPLKLIINLTNFSNTDKFIFGNIEFGEEVLKDHVVLTFDNADGSCVSNDAYMAQDYGDNVTARPQNGYNYGGGAFTPDVNVSYFVDSANGAYMFCLPSPGYADLNNAVAGWLCDPQITFTGSNGKKVQLYGFDLGLWPLGIPTDIDWQVTDGTNILASGTQTMYPYPINVSEHIALDPTIVKANTLVLTASIDGDQSGDFGIDNIIFDEYPPAPKTCGDGNHPYPPGDFNHDCYVNLKDFALLMQQWLTCTDPQPPCSYVAP
jgi:hypothetical protein